MPRTGRPRLPTALKLAKGERRPSRHNSAEPKLPAPKRLDPPADLTGRGLKEWLHVAPQLHKAGSLADTDLAALADYCRRYTDLHAIELEVVLLRRYLSKLEGRKNTDVKDLLSVMRGLDSTERRKITMQNQVNTLRREVGCTSSSRSGVRAIEPPDEQGESEAARYMSAIKGGRA